MTIQFNEAGIVFGPDQLNTAYGQIIAELWEALCQAKTEAEWWRQVATGELFTHISSAVENDDEEPF